MIEEIDGVKYIKVGDKWVPLFESLEDLYKHIEDTKDEQIH